jgi:lipopolysaccharide export system ATP-binding protein
MLKAENIHKSYKDKRILKGVSLEVKKGEVIALLGPNGAGKTTFFYSLVGLVNADKGNISLNSEDITQYPMYIRGRMGLGYLPQENSIFRELTVEENILAIIEITKKKNKNKRSNKQQLEWLIKKFGLEKVRKQKAISLSGGERRRAEIARALATNPDFILLDEPFAGVDPIVVNDIRKLVQQLKELDIGVIITDHNVKETLTIIDRAYIMHEGKILISGTKDEIIANKEVKRVYLGKDFKLE